jgi:hypothetical protein
MLNGRIFGVSYVAKAAKPFAVQSDQLPGIDVIFNVNTFIQCPGYISQGIAVIAFSEILIFVV